MKALFFILIFIALIVACWQFVKILGLTKVQNSTATEKENNINGWLMLVLMVFIYGIMLFSMFGFREVLLPRLSASLEGYHIDNLFIITMCLIFTVQFITQYLIFYYSFKYRGINNRKAIFFADSSKLEAIWTIIPAIVLTLLIGYGLWTWNEVMDSSNAKDPLVIEVYAKQFKWEARYAGNDNTLGQGNVNYIKDINTMGVNMEDQYSKDDVPSDVLYLPKGRKVVFNFRSQDVIHSAYMPHFRAQMNCVPGMVTHFAFTPSVTTQEMRKNQDIVTKVGNINAIRKANGADPYEFDYLLLCNKICGSSHYNMQMKIVVVEEAEFNTWLASQKTMAQVLN